MLICAASSAMRSPGPGAPCGLWRPFQQRSRTSPKSRFQTPCIAGWDYRSILWDTRDTSMLEWDTRDSSMLLRDAQHSNATARALLPHHARAPATPRTLQTHRNHPPRPPSTSTSLPPTLTLRQGWIDPSRPLVGLMFTRKRLSRITATASACLSLARASSCSSHHPARFRGKSRDTSMLERNRGHFASPASPTSETQPLRPAFARANPHLKGA